MECGKRLIPCLFQTLLYHAPIGAPADHERFCVLRIADFRRHERFLADTLQLLETFPVHPAPYLVAFRDTRFFIMLVAVESDESGSISRDTARRDTVLGINIPLVLRARPNHMVFYRLESEIFFLKTSNRIQEILDPQKKDRDLILITNLESLVCETEKLFMGAGSEDHSWEFAVAGVEGQVEVGLFRARRESCGRSRPLADMDDDRGLDHSREAHAFGHEGKAAAGSRDDRPRAGVPGAEPLIYGRDLILGLVHDYPELRSLLCQIGKESRSRRHRVRGDIVAAAGKRAETESIASFQ